MKKLLYLLLVLTIFSCSSDDDNSDDPSNNDNNNILVSKISYDNEDGGSYTYEENFTYDLNKIVERQDISYYNGSIQNTYRAQFIYSNDLIAQVDYYYNDNFDARTTFQYDSQSRLTRWEECYLNSDGSCISDFTSSFLYNSDGTITVVQSSYDSSGGVYFDELTLQLNNQGNIIRATSENDDCESISSINYDDNNTPFKNITGANLINVVYGLFSDAQIFGFFNNMRSIQGNETCNNSSDNYSSTINFSYDYNQYGYPRNIIITETDGGGQYSNTILLEYN